METIQPEQPNHTIQGWQMDNTESTKEDLIQLAHYAKNELMKEILRL